jgi:non-heme chloroperoxidase
MPYVNAGQENSGAITIYYEDHGTGDPVVLVHGYPLNGHSWEKQEAALLAAGRRVITYDRRGFGASSQPSIGYDYDTFATDLNTLLTELDLRDVALVGFSMGTGEVMRYFGLYGCDRIRKAVMIGPLGPFLLKTDDNPGGIDKSVFDGLEAACAGDRPAFMKGFIDNFYNFDVYRGTLVSDQAWQASWNIAVGASAKGSFDCIGAWLTDFRADLPKIDVPTLVIQGSDDRILPPFATGDLLPGLIKDMKHTSVKDGPHAVIWTHADEVNSALLEFIC